VTQRATGGVEGIRKRKFTRRAGKWKGSGGGGGGGGWFCWVGGCVCGFLVVVGCFLVGVGGGGVVKSDRGHLGKETRRLGLGLR